MNAPKNVYDTLDKFFSEKTITDVDRNTYLICNLEDRTNKVTTSLVFMRDWDSLSLESYSQVVVEGKGAVFTFPPYWISVPKELAMNYFQYVIDTFYTEYVAGWIGGVAGSGDTNTGLTGCPCGCVR